LNNKNYIRKKRKVYSAEELIAGINEGNLTALSKAITLCESKKNADRKIASEVVSACMQKESKSIRIGITGVPGVGKSTFIESFGIHLIKKENKRVAVLAVDPSSERTKGSILGDKTRMNNLSINNNAFIRPSPSSGSLGGVANASRESIILCEAAGFDVIFVETVGVGQSETEVHQMTDFFLLLMLAGAGDELQGIKRGIMEMADGLLINKADGDNIKKAKLAKREYQNALHLFPQAKSNWTTQVGICSAIESMHMDQAWKMIQEYETHCKENNYFYENRKKQLTAWYQKSIEEIVHQKLFDNEKIKSNYQTIGEQVSSGSLSPFDAASKLLEGFF
jgi:LAO/AO transport system kinase